MPHIYIRSTFRGTKKDWSAGKRSDKTIPIYTQLDYILLRSRSKSILKDSRSYIGTKLESDHKILCTRINLSTPYLVHKRKAKRIQYDISALKCPYSKSTYTSSITETVSKKVYISKTPIQVSMNSSKTSRVVQLPQLGHWLQDSEMNTLPMTQK